MQMVISGCGVLSLGVQAYRILGCCLHTHTHARTHTHTPSIHPFTAMLLKTPKDKEMQANVAESTKMTV